MLTEETVKFLEKAVERYGAKVRSNMNLIEVVKDGSIYVMGSDKEVNAFINGIIFINGDWTLYLAGR